MPYFGTRMVILRDGVGWAAGGRGSHTHIFYREIAIALPGSSGNSQNSYFLREGSGKG